MPRKRTPVSAAGAVTSGVLLDDDEEFVEKTETTKTVGRKRRTPASEPEPIDAEPVFAVDDDDEDEQLMYSETSLAAAIYDDSSGIIQDKLCSIMVRRNPDSLQDKFVVPCSSLTNLQRLAGVSVTAEKAEIEERVMREYGGGRYFFQVQMDGRLGHSWTATLADLPGWKPPTAETQHEPTTAAAPAAVVNPMDSFLASLRQTAELKGLLFGDTEKELRDEIARLRAENEAARNATPAEPMSEELLLWKMAKEMPESEAKTRLLDKLMPTDADGNTPWYVDAAKLALENKDAIAGVIGSLFGGLTQPRAAQPASVTDMLRQPAPSLPTSRPSVFKKADPAPVEPPPPADTTPTAEPVTEAADLSKGDEAAIDAEVVTDKEPKKNERRKRTAA